MAMRYPINSESDNFSIAGIRIGVTEAGIRYTGRDDLAIFELAEGSTTAATFTLNRFAAAPVQLARQHLIASSSRYLLINAGNANAGTGSQGMADAKASCRLVADMCDCELSEVLPFSTGIIGEYLPMDKLASGIGKAVRQFHKDNWQAAAAAIMTTDTRPKIVREEFTLNGEHCNITGIAKGSGMIHPDMATMLAFLATDATVPQGILQQVLNRVVEDSFNCITVDGDTSTNDACVVTATGKGSVIINDDELFIEAFAAKLSSACKTLAEMIIRDGEGATKLARIQVNGSRSRSESKIVAYTVALSPLVKTALFGQDANWGRILAAVGRSPIEHLDISRVDIYLDDVCIIKEGEKNRWYSEEDGAAVMQRHEIIIRIELNQGESDIEVLTSDLSHDYVSINTGYRS